MTKSSMMKLKVENNLSSQPQMHEITMSKSELPAINHLLQYNKVFTIVLVEIICKITCYLQLN